MKAIYIPYKCAARPTACVAEVLQSALNFSDERYYKHIKKKKSEIMSIHFAKKKTKAQDVKWACPKFC